MVVKLRRASITALKQFWRRPPADEVGRKWGPPERTLVSQLLMSTDASKFAWGGMVHAGRWAENARQTPLAAARGMWPAEAQENHIHLLEM